MLESKTTVSERIHVFFYFLALKYISQNFMYLLTPSVTAVLRVVVTLPQPDSI